MNEATLTLVTGKEYTGFCLSYFIEASFAFHSIFFCKYLTLDLLMFFFHGVNLSALLYKFIGG